MSGSALIFYNLMAKKHIDRTALIATIRELKELSNEQKSDILQLISEQKKYGIVWEDSPEDVEENLRVNVPVLVEDKDRAIISNADDAPNHILIEGDNLEALTALSYTHEGKIDVIYIDPPYNTGNKDFRYNDSFVDSEDGYRHSKWLSFMEKRLKIAKKLLSDKGVIFISIDDNEQADLKLLCDEVLGSASYVACIGWQRTYSTRNDSKGIPKEIESIIVYSKQSLWTPKKLPRTDKMNSLYKSPDNDPKPWTSSSVSAPGASTHQGMVYGIQHPFSGEMMYPTIGRCWSLGQDSMLANLNQWAKYKLVDIHDYDKRAEICGISSADVRKDVLAIVLDEDLETAKKNATNVLKRGNWPYFYFTNGGKGGIRRKTYLDNMEGRVVTNFFNYEECGHTDEAKKEIIAIFDGKAPFDTPKPTRLLKRIEQISTEKNSIILDFFAGSGTTLHATMQLNAEDGGHRQCILCTNNENNICEEVTYERNRRVINGYTTPKGMEVEGLHDNSLRYYKIDYAERENTAANREKLLRLATDMLCVKENIYNEERQFGSLNFKKSIARYFADNDKQMLIVYEPRAIEYIVKELRNDASLASRQRPLKLYVYSDGAYAYNDEFEGLLDRVELTAMPNALIQALHNVLPEPIVDEFKEGGLEND